MPIGHIGSWGTPELGITEWFADRFGAGRNAQGGSANRQAAQTYLSAPVQLQAQQNLAKAQGSFTASNPTGGGNTGGDTLGVSTSSSYTGSPSNVIQDAQQAAENIVPSVDPLMEEINNAYNSRLGSLNSIAGLLRGQLPQLEKEAQTAFEGQKATLDTQKAGSERQINTESEQSRLRKEDAISAAARLYNDLVQRGNQQFGGASSAGEAYQSLLGQEQQRNFGGIERDFSNAQQDIAMQRQNLKDRYDTALLQLQVSRDNAISEARRELDNKLIEIERLRGAAAEDKASARLNALQDYRNSIFQINRDVFNFQQQLDAQAQSAATQISSASSAFDTLAGQAGDARKEFFGQATLNPQNTLQINANDPTFGGGSQMANYIGRVNPKDEEQQYLTA